MKNKRLYETYIKTKKRFSDWWASEGRRWISPLNNEKSFQKILKILGQVIFEHYTSVGLDLNIFEPYMVLDLGCGDGKLVNELGKRYSFIDIIGVDLSRVHLEMAERGKTENVKYIQEDADLILKKYENVAVATMINSLQDVKCPKKTLDNVYNALGQGGYFFLTVPGEKGVEFFPETGTEDGFPVGRIRSKVGLWEQRGFPEKLTESLFKETGFEIQETGKLECDPRDLLPIAHFLSNKELEEIANNLIERGTGPTVNYYLLRMSI